ncbi:GNAT family N-acetyltransferase [Sporosarcina sp. Marseille-Q4063]|uniref:GNAT family N-acetyltransferase n=1 Tax=Sporosarcina sp. Marseille-Q4063 TaxID=2810514 RepID=UPI001BAFFF2E|nr:GNAT family N-acetyltransferase [Sporosarcina sp. Marseille-Q4063]QUW22038.1 GNAT family N-acetyltransferase [Sporosarcina sp. Marseille-Q4063]
MIKQLLLKNGKEIEIRHLSVKNLNEILLLQSKVIDALTTDSFLQPLSKEEFFTILNGKGKMIGAYLNDKLIAFRAMLEPELDDEHLGKDAGLPESEWAQVLYSEITNVDPEFRGNNLQVLLGEIILDEVDKIRYRYICTTVAPFNIASLKDKFAHGLQIVSLKKKYGNMLRYILMKDLSLDTTVTTPLESRYIPMANTEEQQQLLGNGWIGTHIEKRNDNWYVRYEKTES